MTYLEEPLRSLWAGQDPFAAAEALEGQVLRALEGRRTLRTEIAGGGYFVKIHRGAGWREIFKNLLSGRLPVLGAGNEWRALRRLAALGVDTMRPVAFGERGGNPACRHSFLITEELAAGRFADLDTVFTLEGEVVARDSLTLTLRVEINGRCYYVKRYSGLGKKP